MMNETTIQTPNNCITVFLGGTCNGSTWRDELIPTLSERVAAFNPVVDKWDEVAQANEDYHKANDDYCVYVLTPEMTGLYSIFEVADDSNKRPGKVICCFLKSRNGKEFDATTWKGIEKMKRDLRKNGAIVCEDLLSLGAVLNDAASQ